MPLNPLLKFENKLWSSGITHIAGVDEAGRGPLAGPLVVACVILDKSHLYNPSEKLKKLLETYSLINDSKKLTAKVREKMFEFIIKNAISYQIEEIPSQKIDEWGIAKSNQIGFFNSVNRLAIQPEHTLTDHFGIRGLAESKQTNITGGDRRSITIAAASILAKVYRDRLMVGFHEKYPLYGFDRHKGYGTKLHAEMLLRYGQCEIHRRSFKFNSTRLH